MTWSVRINGRTYTPDDFVKFGYAAIFGQFHNDQLEHMDNFLTGSSSSSLTVGTGSKSLTIEEGRSFQSGHPVRIARTSDPTNTWMSGVVTSYNDGSGALVVSVDDSSGSGTHTDWTVLIGGASGPAGEAGSGEATVTTGITASGIQTQGQVPLTSNVNVIGTCATDGNVVTLDSAAAGIWQMVINEGAKELQVFPASGDNLGEGSNTATVLKPGEKEIFWAVDATNWKRESQNFKIDSVLGGSTVGHNLKNSDNGVLVLRMATDHETRRILGRNGANDTTKSGIELRDDEVRFLGDSDASLWTLTKSGFNNPNIVHMFDEFNGYFAANHFGSLGWGKASSGTGANVTTAGTYGTVRKSLGDLKLQAGTTTSGKAGVFLGGAHWDTGICSMDMKWHSVGFDSLSTVSEEYVAFVGFANNTTWSSVTHAIGFLYDRATYGDYWVTVTMASGTATYGNTSAFDPKLYYSSPYGRNLRLVVNSAGTSVAFYYGTTPLTDHTTNIPNNGTSGIFYPTAFINKTAGTTDRQMYTSRFDLRCEFTSRDPFVS